MECDCREGYHAGFDEKRMQQVEVSYNNKNDCWEVIADNGCGCGGVVFEVEYCPFCGAELPK